MDIKTKNLTITSLSPDDKPAMLPMLTDEKIKETYMLPDLATEAAQEKLFYRLLALSQAADHFVKGIYLEDTLIGFLNDVEIADGKIELGYVIAPAHWGHGYMTEALGGVIAFLLENGYEEVITGAFASNLASIRVMEKCGMTKRNKQATIEYRGKLHSCVYYSVKK